MENMFEKGCLVQLSAAYGERPGRSRRSNCSETDGFLTNGLSHQRSWWIPDSLKPMNKVVNAARSYLDGCEPSLPTPGNGLHPQGDDHTVDEKLEEFKE